MFKEKRMMPASMLKGLVFALLILWANNIAGRILGEMLGWVGLVLSIIVGITAGFFVVKIVNYYYFQPLREKEQRELEQALVDQIRTRKW